MPNIQRLKAVAFPLVIVVAVAVAFILGKNIGFIEYRTQHIRFDLVLSAIEMNDQSTNPDKLKEDIEKRLLADYLGELSLHRDILWKLWYFHRDPFNTDSDRHFLKLATDNIHDMKLSTFPVVKTSGGDALIPSSAKK
jgi:hypothetical protein